MKRTSFLSAMLLGLAMGAGAVYAHDDATLNTVKAPSGGQLRMAGIYHYELVVAKDSKDAKDNPVVVYVTDHVGQKIPTTGATGSATLLAGKDKATAALVPDGDNRMKGTAKYASMPGMKAVVSIALPGKAAEQARFTPLVVAPDEHMDHKR
jgi:hypothetical protein